jgi:hypothetical protein
MVTNPLLLLHISPILVEKPEGKTKPGGTKRKQNNNIKMDRKRNTMLGFGTDSSDLRQDPVDGSCRQCNEHPGIIKECEFLYQLDNCQSPMKDCAPWSC